MLRNADLPGSQAIVHSRAPICGIATPSRSFVRSPIVAAAVVALYFFLQRLRRSGVCGGRYSYNRLEIADEVRLVAVAKAQGKFRLIDRRAGRELFRRLVKPVTLDHPLGTYSDVLGE